MKPWQPILTIREKVLILARDNRFLGDKWIFYIAPSSQSEGAFFMLLRSSAARPKYRESKAEMYIA